MTDDTSRIPLTYPSFMAYNHPITPGVIFIIDKSYPGAYHGRVSRARSVPLNTCFSDKQLEALYTHEQDAHKYQPGIVDAFFEVLTIIRAAKDEQDFYTVRSLRAEKLKGKRKGQWSVRLNRQWRLILVIKTDEQGDYAEMLELVDYH